MMIKLLNRMRLNQSGATAAEYALIVAVMGGLVVLGVTTLGGKLATSMGTSGTYLTTSATAGQQAVVAPKAG